jgi:hypothetical protein
VLADCRRGACSIVDGKIADPDGKIAPAVFIYQSHDLDRFGQIWLDLVGSDSQEGPCQVT